MQPSLATLVPLQVKIVKWEKKQPLASQMENNLSSLIPLFFFFFKLKRRQEYEYLRSQEFTTNNVGLAGMPYYQNPSASWNTNTCWKISRINFMKTKKDGTPFQWSTFHVYATINFLSSQYSTFLSCPHKLLSVSVQLKLDNPATL